MYLAAAISCFRRREQASVLRAQQWGALQMTSPPAWTWSLRSWTSHTPLGRSHWRPDDGGEYQHIARPPIPGSGASPQRRSVTAVLQMRGSRLRIAATTRPCANHQQEFRISLRLRQTRGRPFLVSQEDVVGFVTGSRFRSTYPFVGAPNRGTASSVGRVSPRTLVTFVVTEEPATPLREAFAHFRQSSRKPNDYAASGRVGGTLAKPSVRFARHSWVMSSRSSSSTTHRRSWSLMICSTATHSTAASGTRPAARVAPTAPPHASR